MIKNISPETLNLFKQCFDKNGSPKKEENIRWQFLENPVNKQYVDIAVEGNDVAAIYAIFPVEFKMGSDYVTASQSLDTITDIDYRGKGLFVSLAKDVYKKATEDNVSLVYGFPNGNSIHGFSKKLEWQVLDPVPFLIRPFKTNYFTKRISIISWLPNFNLFLKKYNRMDGFNVSLVKSFSSDVNIIWDSFAKKIEVGIKRDKKYLDWRYLNKPNEEYLIAECTDVNGNLKGFIVFTLKEKHGGKVGYIMELLYDLEDSKVADVLLSFALNNLKSKDADCVLAWCLDHSPIYKNFKKEMFFNFPKRLRPIELHFGVRCFNKNFSELVYNRKNWFISYSDSDTV